MYIDFYGFFCSRSVLFKLSNPFHSFMDENPCQSELIMSKWTGIESNQIKSPFNINRSYDKLPDWNSKAATIANIVLFDIPNISRLIHIWQLYLSCPNGEKGKKRTDNRFYIVRPWIYNAISLWIGVYVCLSAFVCSNVHWVHIVGLVSRSRFRKNSIIMSWKFVSSLFWYYMCCNFQAKNCAKAATQKTAHILFGASSHTHEYHLRMAKKPSNRIFPWAKDISFFIFCFSLVCRCNCNIHLFC